MRRVLAPYSNGMQSLIGSGDPVDWKLGVGCLPRVVIAKIRWRCVYFFASQVQPKGLHNSIQGLVMPMKFMFLVLPRIGPNELKFAIYEKGPNRGST